MVWNLSTPSYCCCLAKFYHKGHIFLCYKLCHDFCFWNSFCWTWRSNNNTLTIPYDFLNLRITEKLPIRNWGWPKSKVATSNGCDSESKHFWPYVGKVKMGLRGKQFLKNCEQTAEKCKQIFENWKKTATSQTHFGFTNMGSKELIFRVIAIWKGKFWFGSLCTYNFR